MPFNLFGKRKKYPFNKQKKNPAAAVYAGPEYFARRNGQRPEEEVLDVYAGPEYFEDRLTPPEEIGKTFEEDAPLPPEDEEKYNTIYAGPEPLEETAPVYAGPEPAEEAAPDGGGEEPPRERAALVYAGPEFFARRRAEVEALAAGVYAGPEPPAAGMGGISGSMGMMGAAFVPAPQAAPVEEGKAEKEE